MYITVKFYADVHKPNRWIPLNDNSTVAEVETVVNTIRCVPGVEEVYVNVKDTNYAKKTDNTTPTS